MRILRDVLCLTLIASGLVGYQILLNDRWLWSSEPSHAYGLIGFVIVDLLLAIAVLGRTSVPVLGAVVTAATQLSAMLADTIAGKPAGTSSFAFRSYLINDGSFLALLITQAGILIIATGALTAQFLRNRHWMTFLRHSARQA